MHALAYHAYVLHIYICAYMHGSFSHNPSYELWLSRSDMYWNENTQDVGEYW